MPRKLCNRSCVLRKELLQLRSAGHFKIGEIKSGRHRASDKRAAMLSIARFRRLPDSCHNHKLRPLTRCQIPPESHTLQHSIWRDCGQFERISLIEMPDLIRTDPMKSRKGTCGQQIIDRRAGSPNPSVGKRDLCSRTEGFHKIPTLGMGCQPKPYYQIIKSLPFAHDANHDTRECLE